MLRCLFNSAMAAAVASAAAAPAFADVKAGVDAWSRGDYAAAVREWKGPADNGDADAQFNLGQAYKLGRGVPRDLTKAEELFGKAAASGHLQASDNYGLLLFQRGEHARAMPYINAAASRGDARAQYLLGLAYFNADNVPKDWVRGYALVSLAQRAGLPQAVPALAKMDQYIPLEQRQEGVKLSAQLAADAEATRARQFAAIDLGAAAPNAGTPARDSMSKPSFSPGARVPIVPSAPNGVSPSTTGADYTRPRRSAPRVPTVADTLDLASPPASPPAATAAPAPPPPAKPVPAQNAQNRTTPVQPAQPRPAASGDWRVQLGAFGVPGNADALWNRVKGRPELAGHAKLLVPAGRLKKLQAGGFASGEAAQTACKALSAAGFDCLPVKD